MTISNVQAPEDLPMGNPTDRAYAGMFEQTKTPVTEMKTVDVAGSKSLRTARWMRWPVIRIR